MFLQFIFIFLIQKYLLYTKYPATICWISIRLSQSIQYQDTSEGIKKHSVEDQHLLVGQIHFFSYIWKFLNAVAVAYPKNNAWHIFGIQIPEGRKRESLGKEILVFQSMRMSASVKGLAKSLWTTLRFEIRRIRPNSLWYRILKRQNSLCNLISHS